MASWLLHFFCFEPGCLLQPVFCVVFRRLYHFCKNDFHYLCVKLLPASFVISVSVNERNMSVVFTLREWETVICWFWKRELNLWFLHAQQLLFDDYFHEIVLNREAERNILNRCNTCCHEPTYSRLN